MHQFFDSTDLRHWPLLFLFLFLRRRRNFNFMLFVFKRMRKKIFLIWITNIFACFTADFHIMDVVMLNRTFFIFVFYICGCRIFNRYFTSTAVKTWNETNINQVLTKAELYFSDFWTVFKYALWLSNFHFLCTCSPMDIVSSFIYKCYNTWTEVCIFIWQENLIFFLFYGKKKNKQYLM